MQAHFHQLSPVFRVDPHAWHPLVVHISTQHLVVLKVVEGEGGQVMDLGAEKWKMSFMDTPIIYYRRYLYSTRESLAFLKASRRESLSPPVSLTLAMLCKVTMNRR